MLRWFDENPARYWCLVCFAIIWTLFIMLRPLLRPDWRDVRRTDWGWGLIILSVLFVGRWPTWFVTRPLDPDENQFIAGALTLRHDPVFWRSVEGMTSGPFDYYALWPAGWVHGVDNYFTARVTAFFLIAVTFVLIHQACALMCGVMVARITGFATLCFEALALRSDFLHYSSELVPICLLGTAVFLMVRRFAGGAGWRHSLAGGIVLGSIPLAKLQAVPLAVLLGLGWVIMEIWQRRAAGQESKKGALALVAGLIVPLLTCAIFLTFFNLWSDVVISYLLSNVGYVGSIYLPMGEVMGMIWRTASAPDTLLPYWLAGSGLWLLLSLPLFWSARSTRWLPMAGAGIFCLTSIACILIPRRPYMHYWQFLVVPWTLLFAIGAEAAYRRLERAAPVLQRGLLLSALLFSTGALLLARSGKKHPYVGRLALYQAHPMGRVARELRKYAKPGEALGVWGWMANFYAETGLRQATREAFSHMQILDNPYYEYYRRRYLSDLQHSAPPVFVDAIGPVNFGFPPDRLRHDEIFPALATYVRTRYSKVADLDGVQIFVRNDRLRLVPP